MSDFSALLNSYYPAWFRFHPEVAVDIGIRGHESQLTPFSEDDIGALVVLNKKLLTALDSFDRSRLTPAQAIDIELMYGAALIELRDLIEQDWRYRDPTRFLPVHAIYQLTLRDLAHNKPHLKNRLAAIPSHLRNAQSYLQTEPGAIPAVWVESAIQEAVHGAEYFRSLRQHPEFMRLRLLEELELATHALEDFARFLDKTLLPRAAGKFACGLERFERLLNYQHALPVSADTLYQFGERLFNQTLQELRVLTRELQGDEDIRRLTDQIQAEHPAPHELLQTYRQTMQAARGFLAARDLVSLPQPERLEVAETPVFLRHQIPFAAYMPPPFNDPQQRGIYYVTPVGDTEGLGEHNSINLRHTCVHEAWPGHHLQFVTANLAPRASSLPRLVNPSATLYEGWALYSEQLMQEQGFLDAPVSRFILLKDRLWRALRVMLDVELHTRGSSLEQAAERMQLWLGFTRRQAMADLSWYSQSPGVPMGYATGWALINATRERLRAVQQPFSLKTFHDRLLAEGSIPLAHAIRSQFGQPIWESVQRSVFKNP